MKLLLFLTKEGDYAITQLGMFHSLWPLNIKNVCTILLPAITKYKHMTWNTYHIQNHTEPEVSSV